MTEYCSSGYFGDTKAYRLDNYYRVVLVDEERRIILRKDLVDNISEKTGDDENLIAILLAYIDCARINSTKSHKKPKPLDDKIIIEGILILLNYILIEKLISIIKLMKWNEIVDALKG